jgi:hypothetical protein
MIGLLRKISPLVFVGLTHATTPNSCQIILLLLLLLLLFHQICGQENLIPIFVLKNNVSNLKERIRLISSRNEIF